MVHKLSVNLHSSVVAAIQEMAGRRSVTQTEVIRDAIGTEKFIFDEREKGAKFLLEYPNGKTTVVVFR